MDRRIWLGLRRNWLGSRLLPISVIAVAAFAFSGPAKAQSPGDVAAEVQAEGGGCLESVANVETGGTFQPHIVSDNGVYVGLFQFDGPTWASTSVGQSGISRAVATVAQQVAAATELLMAGLGRQSWPNTLPAGC